MEITYWYGPPRTFLNAETYEDVKNAGFTLAGPMGSAGVNTEDNLKFLDLCREKGLKACVHDRRMHHALRKYENGEADWDAPLKSMTEDYKHHPALACYYVIDEPSAGMFRMLGDIIAKLKD